MVWSGWLLRARGVLEFREDFGLEEKGVVFMFFIVLEILVFKLDE